MLASVIYYSGWTGTNDPAVARAALGITSSTDLFSSAILGHLIGDFILQNDWIAGNKKKPGPDGNAICMLHCFLWTTSVMLFAGWSSVPAFIILFVLHFIQDRTDIIYYWMEMIGQKQFMRSDHIQLKDAAEKDEMIIDFYVGLGPWSVILVDNIFHLVTIWLVWKFVV